MTTLPVSIPILTPEPDYIRVKITLDDDNYVVATTYSGGIKGSLVCIPCSEGDFDYEMFYVVMNNMKLESLDDVSFKELLFIHQNKEIIKQMDTIEEVLSLINL